MHLFPRTSYNLYIQERRGGGGGGKAFSVVKDISASASSYVTGPLECNSFYIVYLSVSNAVGESKNASRSFNTTCTDSGEEDAVPYIFYRTGGEILRKDIRMSGGHFWSPPVRVLQLNKEESIVNFGLHQHRGLIFAATRGGSLYRGQLGASSLVIEGDPLQMAGLPPVAAVSVDWLNDRLYILTSSDEGLSGRQVWSILHCSLEGSSCQRLEGAARGEVTQILVEPLQGALFLTERGPEGDRLYRQSLHVPGCTSSRSLLLSRPHLGTFVISLEQQELYVPAQDTNEMIRISLNRTRDIGRAHANYKNGRPEWKDTRGLIYFEDRFYWTSNKGLVLEQFSEASGEYKTGLLLGTIKSDQLELYHLSTQPVPVPINPVEDLQVIFGTDRAVIKWREPEVEESDTCEGWRSWRYRVEVTDHSGDVVVSQDELKEKAWIVREGLESANLYKVQVQPWSLGGLGPWSREFAAKTYQGENGNSQVLWSDGERVFKVDLFGENLGSLQVNEAENILTDGRDGSMYWTRGTKVMGRNEEGNEVVLREERWEISSLALDSLGRKLYYAVPNLHRISRLALDGGGLELNLPLITVARNLVVDSMLAKICWVYAQSSVECSGLNGENVQTISKFGLWEDNKVVNLALDAEKHLLYITIYNPVSGVKYTVMEHRLDGSGGQREVGALSLSGIQGRMEFLDGKLFFIQNSETLVTYDIEGKGLSTIPLKSPVTSFCLAVSATMTNGSFSVSPDSVESSTIKFSGTHENYQLVWNEVKNVNYGQVKYKVRLYTKEQSQVWTVSAPPILVQSRLTLPSFSPVNISIVAFTAWSQAKPAQKSLRTPESLPGAPETVRLYWSRVNGTGTAYTLRWRPPSPMNGRLESYQIGCMQGGKDHCKGLQTRQLEAEVFLPEGDYNFTVAAGNGAGLGSKGSPPGLPCCPRPRSLPVPRLALGVAHPAGVITADADTAAFALRPLHAPPILMAALAAENALITVDSIGRVKRLDLATERMSEIFDLKTRPTSITLDWVGRYLFWAEHKGSKSSISMLDIAAEKPKPKQILVPKQGKIVKIAYHVSGTLYFNVHTTEGIYRVYKGSLKRNGSSYETIHVTGRHRRRRSGSGCTCPDIRSVDTFQLVPSLAKDTNVQLIIRDANTGNILLTDDTLCNCDILMKTENVDQTIALAADLTYFYIQSYRQGVIHMVGRYDRKTTTFKVNNTSVPQILEPLCSECQKLNDISCVLPEAPSVPLQVAEIEATRISLHLPEPTVASSCSPSPPLPSTTFTVAASTNPNEALALCLGSSSFCQKVSFYNQGNAVGSTINLINLSPNTRYAIHMHLQNLYSIKRNITNPSKGITWIRTKEAAPSAPRNVTASVLSPTEVQLTWQEPAFIHSDEVEYEVHWQSKGFIGGQVRSGQQRAVEKRATVSNLVPAQQYKLWVRAVTPTNITGEESESVKKIVKTFEQPNSVVVMERGPRYLLVSWKAPNHTNIVRHSLIYYAKDTDTDTFRMVNVTRTLSGKTYKYTLDKLSPGECYVIKTNTFFSTAVNTSYIWPKDDSHCERTEEDKPLVPGVPYIVESNSGQVVVTWQENDENVESYELQQKSIEQEESWRTIYMDNLNNYVVTGIENGTFSFRVRARNRFGVSSYSDASQAHDIEKIRQSQLQSKAQSKVVTITAITTTVVGFILLVFIILCMITHNRNFNEKKINFVNTITPLSADLELANLRELPIRNGFIDANNPMYQMEMPTDEELALIPKIKRSQITLTQFLGSGAFGEVFEGTVKELNSEAGSTTKIAVKTLRKGATESEKIEFLNEAKLMWNFKHDHILSLVAICLDNNPNFLILELMEAGDLLSYLRANRPNAVSQGVTLVELAQMCLDVARGCEYLEQLHFVHRDIAARNCLVSSVDPDKRRIKIGDFGLARDIYKNDYYKKEGEGLLPVRWMAPESLMDGVFSCQSDVWSFGVLLWEILTMGAKPYPTMSNLEVLQYVRSGGRLERPSGSPGRLHFIMNSCWSQDPDHRPTFKMCVQEIEALLDAEAGLSEISGYTIRRGHEFPGTPSLQPLSSTSSAASSHYHSATTMPVSQVSAISRRSHATTSSGLGSATPNYLQLVGEEYVVPRPELGIGSRCGCDSGGESSDAGGGGYQNLRTQHLQQCRDVEDSR